MTPEDYLIKVQNWTEKDTGMFDFNGLVNLLKNYSKDLQHFYDSSKGLYATDRPELVEDPKKVLFQL